MSSTTKSKVMLPRYEVLFPFIDYFEQCPKQEWSEGSHKDGVFTMPFCNFSKEVHQFLKVFYESDVADKNYIGTLELYGVDNLDDLTEAIPFANAELLLAMLTLCIRRDRFCDGFLDSVIQKGIVASILKRLRELHESEEKAEEQEQSRYSKGGRASEHRS